MSDLVRRQLALEKTLRKYEGRPFDWKAADCIRMARSQLVAMGHKRLPRLPHYSSALGAQRALKSTGHESVEALLAAILPRITPAAMLPGDFAVLRGEEPFGAGVTICTGRMLFGWHQDEKGAGHMVPSEIVAAFRA